MRQYLTLAFLALYLGLSCAGTSEKGTPGDDVVPENPADNTSTEAIDEGTENELPFDPTAGLEDGNAEIGEAYFYGDNRGRCLICHTLRGEGFEGGWALDDAGLIRDAEWLARWIDNPRNLRPEIVIMPPFRGDSEGATIADIVAFLMTLRTEIEHPDTSDIKPDDEPEPNHDGIAGSGGSHGEG